MPGAGKSTIGIILAKNLGLGFIDTDVLIQINQQNTLQKIIDESDHLNLRAIEEKEILKLILKIMLLQQGVVLYTARKQWLICLEYQK